jgi:hypothetical protein
MMDQAMLRNALVTLAAIIVVGAGFASTFALWRHMDEARAFALGFPYSNFNWNTVHAQERGCNACHANLAADVNKFVTGRDRPELHGIFATSYDIPMRVEDCMICHNKRTDLAFAGSIHSRHLHAASFRSMGGSCDSCHGTTLDGKFMLYDDEFRYRILNGINYTPTPPFSQSSSAAGVPQAVNTAKAE